MRRSGTRVLGLIFLWLLAAAAVACGSSSPASPTPQPTPVAAETAEVASPVAVESPLPTPTAVATSAPAPVETATATATASPAAIGSAGAESPDSLASRLGSEAMEFLSVFTEQLSPRASGTSQEGLAAEFLRRQFRSLGYTTELQLFTRDVVESDITLLGVAIEALEELRSLVLTLSGVGETSGLLVNVGKAFEGDLPEDLDGKIALIERGEISFAEKVARVAEAGALSAVVYNNLPGLFSGTLRSQGEIPVIALSQEAGQAILEAMSGGDVEASVSVQERTVTSQNVLAEKPGADGGGAVVLGGHYDTVPDVPGANDNGSGIAALIAVAREAAGRDYPFELRFIAFGAEELGLFGSQFYIGSLEADERAEIVAMLNFDALAGGAHLGVLGDPELAAYLIAYAGDQGLGLQEAELPDFTSSDHAPFEAAGIPVVFFTDDEFSRIHTPEDNLDFVNVDALGAASALGLALLDMLADR